MKYKLRKGQRIWDDVKKIKTLPQTGTTLRKHGGLMVRSTELVKIGKTAWLRSPVKFTPWALAAGATLWGAGHLLKKYGKTKGTVSEGGRRFPVSKGPQDPGMSDKQLKITTPGPKSSGYKEKKLPPYITPHHPSPQNKVKPIIKDRYILYGGVKVYPKGRQFRGY